MSLSIQTISPEDQRETKMASDANFYKKLLDQMSDGVYFVDRNRKIQYWNEGASRLTGYSSQELVGRPCQDNILCHVDMEGHELCLEGCPLTACIEDGKAHNASVFLRHRDGHRVPVAIRVQPIRETDGSISGAIEIFSDDTAQNEARRKINEMERLAFLDHLTQLPNRRFMEMSLCLALSEYQMHSAPFGVLMVDLDKFKNINDIYGHACGDRTLQEVAKTLSGSLRPTDIVGRWGGDEFLAIARNVDSEILGTLATRCVIMVKGTSILTKEEIRLSQSISVGAALIQPGETVESLIHRADELLYRSKADGRNRATVE
jgi:diguanylate cyclase (GGDEF)-like protein/PAS domain S-box-containing protein